MESIRNENAIRHETTKTFLMFLHAH